VTRLILKNGFLWDYLRFLGQFCHVFSIFVTFFSDLSRFSAFYRPLRKKRDSLKKMFPLLSQKKWKHFSGSTSGFVGIFPLSTFSWDI